MYAASLYFPSGRSEGFVFFLFFFTAIVHYDYDLTVDENIIKIFSSMINRYKFDPIGTTSFKYLK